jgi:hypothetical protein
MMARRTSNAWPVDLEREEDGRYVVTLPDIG